MGASRTVGHGPPAVQGVVWLNFNSKKTLRGALVGFFPRLPTDIPPPLGHPSLGFQLPTLQLRVCVCV